MRCDFFFWSVINCVVSFRLFCILNVQFVIRWIRWWKKKMKNERHSNQTMIPSNTTRKIKLYSKWIERFVRTVELSKKKEWKLNSRCRTAIVFFFLLHNLFTRSSVFTSRRLELKISSWRKILTKNISDQRILFRLSEKIFFSFQLIFSLVFALHFGYFICMPSLHLLATFIEIRKFIFEHKSDWFLCFSSCGLRFMKHTHYACRFYHSKYIQKIKNKIVVYANATWRLCKANAFSQMILFFHFFFLWLDNRHQHGNVHIRLW